MEHTADRATSDRCGCEPRVEGHRLVVDATDCPAGGRLASSPACRARLVIALTPAIVSVRTRIAAGTVVQPDAVVGLLHAAARFAALVERHDEDLARRVRYDPVRVGRAVVGRSDRTADLAAETGLAEGVHRVWTGGEFGADAELNPLTSAGDSSPMLHDIDDAGDLAPGELRARYDDRLRAVVHERGVERVADESGVETETVRALVAGDSPELTLDEAAAVLAVSESEPPADVVVTEARDALLLGMTTAVLDVEAVESGIGGSFDAREIQQKIEGRLPMTLDELAEIHGYIEAEKP